MPDIRCYLPGDDEDVERFISTDLDEAELLIIVGTPLKTEGIAMVVKNLANHIKKRSGHVIYVDPGAINGRIWDRYIDIHLKLDLQEWSRRQNAAFIAQDQVSIPQPPRRLILDTSLRTTMGILGLKC